MPITIESLKETLQKLQNDLNTYSIMSQQCAGAIKLIQSQIDELHQEHAPKEGEELG